MVRTMESVWIIQTEQEKHKHNRVLSSPSVSLNYTYNHILLFASKLGEKEEILKYTMALSTDGQCSPQVACLK